MQELSDGLLVKTISKVGNARAAVLNEYIKLHIQPKPKWLPSFVWHYIIKRLLVLTIRKS